MSAFEPAQLEALKRMDLGGGRYTSEVVEVEGIISPSGVGASKQILLFQLEVWRRPGNSIVNERLVVHQALAEGAPWPTTYTPLSIHRWNVLLAEGGKRAIIVSRASAPPDPAGLSEVVERMTAVVSFHSDLFGTLTLNRGAGCFEGEAIWNDHAVTICLDANKEHSRPDENALVVATSLWSDPGGWEEKVKACLIAELLPIHNKNWREEDAPELDAEQFISFFSLNCVQIRESGWFTFWFIGDDDLFGGHDPYVDGGVQDGVPFLSAAM